MPQSLISLSALPKDRSENLMEDYRSKSVVLATDLDGTFLGGSDDDRRELYRWVEDNRAAVGLVFVTGRDPEFIIELCAERGVPWPDYVVGDVGTTIARVVDRESLEPIEALEAIIADAWMNSGPRVKEALHQHPGLALQPTNFRYRVSYDYDPKHFDGSAHEIVRDLGLDTLISADRYFDVLPKGVSKGPSLTRLVSHLGIEPSRVLTAGDTMNDLSMLAVGLPAVAVGGSEPDLIARVRQLPHVHVSDQIGAAGITDALRVLDFNPAP
jgi:HAD superfamily hydrolase (TIGR01484 family)